MNGTNIVAEKATPTAAAFAAPAAMTKSCWYCGSKDLSQVELCGRDGRCRYCGSLPGTARTAAAPAATDAGLASLVAATSAPAAPIAVVGIYMGSDAVNADNLRKAGVIVERVTGKAPTVITETRTGARVYVVNGYEQRFNTVEFVKLARQLNGEGARAAEVAAAMAARRPEIGEQRPETGDQRSETGERRSESGERRVESADAGLVKQLPLAQIRRDGGTQPRAALDNETLVEYAEAMAAGSLFPPVTVYYDGHDYWLADGFHRVNAAITAGRTSINVNVSAGTQREAILYSTGANADHGLRRTNADKRRAVERLLRDDEWVKWSDREISRRCAVSDVFVGTLRRQLSANGLQIDERKVVRDGTEYTMNTATIGQAVQSEQIGRTPAAQDMAPIWQLEQAVYSWVQRTYPEHGVSLTVLGNLKQDKNNSVYWAVVASVVGLRHRHGDLIQAINNVHDHLLQAVNPQAAPTPQSTATPGAPLRIVPGEFKNIPSTQKQSPVSDLQSTTSLADLADLADSITPERLDQLKHGIRQWLKFSLGYSGGNQTELLQGILSRRTRSQQSDFHQLTVSRLMPAATPGERLLAVQAMLQEMRAATPATSAPKPPARDLDEGYRPRSVRDPALMERRRVAREEAGLQPDSENQADYGQVLAGVKAWLHRYCAPNNQYAVMASLAANSAEAHDHWRNLYVSPYLPLVYIRNDLQLANTAMATALGAALRMDAAAPAATDADLAPQPVAATPAADDLAGALAVLAANLTDDQRHDVGENLARMAADEAEWARDIEAGRIKDTERLIIHQTTMAMLYLIRDAIR